MKSTRRQEIIGEFGEHLVCTWLSPPGFEVSRVDRTRIDVVACNRKTQERLGIKIKSRTGYPDQEKGTVNMMRIADRQKTDAACEFFGFQPWVTVYVESATAADLYLPDFDHCERIYCVRDRAICYWEMGAGQRQAYASDPEVTHMRIEFTSANWWSPAGACG